MINNILIIYLYIIFLVNKKGKEIYLIYKVYLEYECSRKYD
jgi:hypothetical protein